MAESTNIAWCTSTFNPWIGCTKVSPGCDHCYAEAQDARKRWGGVAHWGAGVPRHRTSKAYWDKPVSWNLRQQALVRAWEGGCDEFGGEDSLLGRGFIKPEPWRVFAGSLCDVFDNEVPDQWRDDLCNLIEATPYLEWLLVTKRIGNVRSMVPAWAAPTRCFPANVRVLITVVNQEEADRDVPKLLALPCKNGVSFEPALGPIDFFRDFGNCDMWDYLRGERQYGESGDASGVGAGLVQECTRHVEWLIVGGESAQGGPARLFDVTWARDSVLQCRAAGVPVFVKQIGSRPHFPRGDGLLMRDRAGADPTEWPEDLRVREFPA